MLSVNDDDMFVLHFFPTVLLAVVLLTIHNILLDSGMLFMLFFFCLSQKCRYRQIRHNIFWYCCNSQRRFVLLSVYILLATDICNKDYGNCTNPCAAENKECCHCEMSHVGSAKVCSCCPQVLKIKNKKAKKIL